MRATGPVVVTGGSTGLGLAVAGLLADRGRAVTITEHVHRAPDPAPGIATARCDLARDRSIDDFVDGLDPPPMGLVHCATVFDRRPLARRRAVDPATTAVHLTGFDRLVRRLATAGRHPARVVLVGSAGAVWGGSGLSVYSAHKSAMRGYVRALADEWLGHGTVNLVEPGPMATELATARQDTWRRDADRSRHPVPVAPPDQVAATIAFLLGDDAANVTGAVIPVDGGLMAAVHP